MDPAPGTTAPPSSSPPADPRVATGTGASPRHDELMLSSFTGLNLRGSSPRGSAPGRDPARASATAAGIRPAFALPERIKAGDGGSVETASSAGPRLAAGRGRGRTLPSWMTGGEVSAAVPGGLQEQPSAGSGAMAGGFQGSAEFGSSRLPVGGGAMAGVSQAAAPGFDASRSRVGSDAMVGVSQWAAGFHASGLQASTCTDQRSGSRGEASTQQTKKKKNRNKAKNRDKYDSKHHTSNSHYGKGNDGVGDGPNGTSGMRGQSSSSSSNNIDSPFATAPATRWQPPQAAPSAGMSFPEPAKPAVSFSSSALPAAGRGVQRTRPAWMVAGVAAAPGGLRQEASFGSGSSKGRKPRSTGLYSSRSSPSAESTPRPSQDSSHLRAASDGSTSATRGQQDQSSRAGTFHGGRADSGGAAVTPGFAQRKGVSISRHTADKQKTPATVGKHAPRAGVPARTLFSGSPAAAAAAAAAAPGGSHQGAPAKNGFAWMPSAGDLFASCLQQGSPFGQEGSPPKDVHEGATKDGDEADWGLGGKRSSLEISTSRGDARSGGQHDGVMAFDGQSPAPVLMGAASGSAPNQAASVGGLTSRRLSAAGSEAWELSGQLLRPKRDRDEGQQSAKRSRVVPDHGLDGGAPEQDAASAVGMEGLMDETGSTRAEPCTKKEKAAGEKSGPSKDGVTARSRFRIVRHDAIPKPGRMISGERTLSASTIAGDYSGTSKGKELSAPASGPSFLPSMPASAAKGEPATPRFVVIDGNNAGTFHQEAGGSDRWSARGPLLAVQYFEQRGVPCVALLSRDRVAGVTPRDAAYADLQKARADGKISEIPPKAKGSQYIHKHAMDRGAHLVTNERPQPHGVHLAALGRTKEELKAYLARHRLGYTFVQDEFVLDPRASLTQMLKRQASTSRRGQVVIAQH